MAILLSILDRLKEPSTWAGIAGLAMVAGLSMETYELYATAITGVAALLAVILKEQTGAPGANALAEKDLDAPTS